LAKGDTLVMPSNVSDAQVNRGWVTWNKILGGWCRPM